MLKILTTMNSVTTWMSLGILSSLLTMMKLSKSMFIQKIQDLLCKKVSNMVAWSR
ncbi:Uncharacterised protein [Mycobacterium tuberculosis]|nr:Uncharacterised protein [Mycobacterium tuberculosis]